MSGQPLIDERMLYDVDAAWEHGRAAGALAGFATGVVASALWGGFVILVRWWLA